jgi:UDP-N-acetylglucosamine 1-carboxyvinyltransferase
LDKFVIHGGKKLQGEVTISGAKNASLALMPATLLAPGIYNLYNTPELNDVFTMMKLLNHLGVIPEFRNNLLKLDSNKITSQDAPYEHVKKMRASVYVLGPLLARFGVAKVSLPGGCSWGPRPINLHLEGLKKMGAEISLSGGYIIAKSPRLKGAKISFDISSVGATGNILMASVLAKGETNILNAAIEPEITNLAQFLQKMGAQIAGIGTANLLIEGVDSLKSSDIDTIPDRIEAGTILIASALTKGKVRLNNINSNLLLSIINKLENSGCKLLYNNEFIELDASNNSIKSIDVTTSVFPGFPTDMQAQWTAYMSLADGFSTVTDSIYLDRFKLGANISVNENCAFIRGVNKLMGAKVMSTDLRASASLVLAGLAAEGTTEVLRVYHLDRGYQRIEEKLRFLGADIERVEGKEF